MRRIDALRGDVANVLQRCALHDSRVCQLTRWRSGILKLTCEACRVGAFCNDLVIFLLLGGVADVVETSWSHGRAHEIQDHAELFLCHDPTSKHALPSKSA